VCKCRPRKKEPAVCHPDMWSAIAFRIRPYVRPLQVVGPGISRLNPRGSRRERPRSCRFRWFANHQVIPGRVYHLGLCPRSDTETPSSPQTSKVKDCVEQKSLILRQTCALVTPAAIVDVDTGSLRKRISNGALSRSAIYTGRRDVSTYNNQV